MFVPSMYQGERLLHASKLAKNPALLRSMESIYPSTEIVASVSHLRHAVISELQNVDKDHVQTRIAQYYQTQSPTMAISIVGITVRTLSSLKS